MSIIPWDPFREVEHIFNRDNFFPAVPSSWLKFPLTDIYEEGKNLVVKISLPDIDPKKIQINIADKVLHIVGKNSKTKETKKKNYYQKEIQEEGFERKIVLPLEVQAKKATATYQNGTLMVKIPKAKTNVHSSTIPIKIKK